MRPEDSFALILFNHTAKVIQPLQAWKDIDAIDLEKQIRKLRADGGTDISAAVREASKMFTSKETERFVLINFILLLLCKFIYLKLERDIQTEYFS